MIFYQPISKIINQATVRRLHTISVFCERKIIYMHRLAGKYQRFQAAYNFHLQGWRWRHNVPPKRLYLHRSLHSITNQKTTINILPQVKLFNLCRRSVVVKYVKNKYLAEIEHFYCILSPTEIRTDVVWGLWSSYSRGVATWIMAWRSIRRPYRAYPRTLHFFAAVFPADRYLLYPHASPPFQGNAAIIRGLNTTPPVPCDLRRWW